MYLDVHRLTDVDLGGDDRADGGVPGAHDDGHVVRGRGVIRGRGGEALVTSGGPGPGQATHGGRGPVSLVSLMREADTVREEHQLVSSVKVNIISQSIKQHCQYRPDNDVQTNEHPDSTSDRQQNCEVIPRKKPICNM